MAEAFFAVGNIAIHVARYMLLGQFVRRVYGYLILKQPIQEQSLVQAGLFA
jgi:hypothetical protein